jgi:hypothetical protein
LQNDNGSNWSEATRRSIVMPSPRCGSLHAPSPGGICGEIARYQGRLAGASTLAYFCELHRPIAAWPIQGEQVIRRACLHLEVYIALVDEAPGDGRTEAYDRLEQAIRRVGGISNLRADTAETVQGTPVTAAHSKRMARARG